MKKMLIAGMVLFLLAILNGMFIPYMSSSSAGITAHLTGVQNAILLIGFGLMWRYLAISPLYLSWCLVLSIYGMYTIWLAQFFSAVWNISAITESANIAASTTDIKSYVTSILSFTGILAIIIASIQIIVGLVRGHFEEP